MENQKPFSKRESEVSALLAEGYSNREICDKLQIALSNLHVVLSHIRKKTGAASKRKQFSKPVDQCPNNDVFPPLTTRQYQIMQRLQSGESYQQIATALGLKIGTVYLHASAARKAAGMVRQWVPAPQASTDVNDY